MPAHGGREHDACFSSMPVPDRRLLGDAPLGLIHGLMTARIPWWQGKMQGISRIQPFFANIRIENISEFRYLRMNSLRRQSREFFCQRREFFCRAGNEQGIRPKTDPRAPTHPMASEYFSVLDTKIINTMVACADEQLGFSGPVAPRMCESSPGSNPGDAHDETESAAFISGRLGVA